MKTVAAAIVCKTPAPGKSKTRLSPPLREEECATLSACFIQDLSRTIETLTRDGDVTGYAVYTPLGSEDALRRLLPPNFRLVPQCEGDLGERLSRATIDLLDAGHDGVILIGSDSPTLPASILRAAADALRRGDNVVLSPAHDGGYTLVGLSQPHPRLFEDMPWSTAAVYQLTLRRAVEIGLPVVNVPGWYDVDDNASLQILEDEIAGKGVTFSGIQGADAPATRAFLRQRRAALITAAGSFSEPHAGHG
jgi:rSAM/selenodomain-associated transferase 1